MSQAKRDLADLHAEVGREHLPEYIHSNLVPIPIRGDIQEASGAKVAPDWLRIIDSSIVSSSELASLHLVPRKRLLGDWLCEGDLGIIYAFRGVGKTWLSLLIARALSEGGSVGEWKAHTPTKVLYIDGEMPADLMRDRDSGLSCNAGEIEFLNHEILFDRTQKVLNITNRELQDAIMNRCIRDDVKMVVLDNLSTLASGMKENDAFAWEQVNNWLLQFRRHKSQSFWFIMPAGTVRPAAQVSARMRPFGL